MPTPSVPSGPGSIHAPSLFTGRIFAAVATMSPPSPITIGSSSVVEPVAHLAAHALRVDRRLVACRAPPRPSPLPSLRSRAARRASAEKSSRTPWFFISSSSSSKLQARLPTRPTSRLAVLPDQRRVHVELDDLRVGRESSCRRRAGNRAACRRGSRSRICLSASRRERFRNSGEVGGTVPRPMPFVNAGMCVSLRKRFSSRARARPLHPRAGHHHRPLRVPRAARARRAPRRDRARAAAASVRMRGTGASRPLALGP